MYTASLEFCVNRSTSSDPAGGKDPTTMIEETVFHRDSTSSKNYYVVLFLIAAFSVWLRTGFPVCAMPYMRHDDVLYIRLARYLEARNWLGPYDNLTLAKGMVYPLFIVIAFWASVPLKIAEQLVYLGACALTAGVVRRQTDSHLSLILFALLAFNPVSWNISLARVLRQGLYMSLSLAVVTLVVVVAFPTSSDSKRSVRGVIFKGVGLGLLSAAYWMTREEGLWLVPVLAVVVGVALAGTAQPERHAPSERAAFPQRSTHLKVIVLPLALALATFTAADLLVALVNYRHYGIFETNEFRSKSFLRAYGALLRIQHEQWRPFITFPKDARQRAYTVSPAARELASSLEGATGNQWLQISCSLMKTKPCVEVEAGWALWEFRDAVANAGHYTSGAEAMRYYDTLADQIDSACARGAIQCLPARATLAPPFRWEYLGESVHASKAITRVLFRMVDQPVGSDRSVGPAQGIAIFADTVGSVYLPEKDPIVVRGWAAAAVATPTLKLVANTPDDIESSISITPAPDVLAVYPTLKSVRFELKTDCPVAACDLILDAAGGGQSRIPLAQVAHPASNASVLETPGQMLYVDSVLGLDTHKFTDSRRAAQVKMAGLIASAYAALFPVLAIVGGSGLLLAMFFRRRCPIPGALVALGLGSAVAVSTLIVLLSYLAASSDFTVANVLYTSPASPFVITFTTLGIYSWFVALRNGSRQWAQHSSLQARVARPDSPGHAAGAPSA